LRAVPGFFIGLKSICLFLFQLFCFTTNFLLQCIVNCLLSDLIRIGFYLRGHIIREENCSVNTCENQPNFIRPSSMGDYGAVDDAVADATAIAADAAVARCAATNGTASATYVVAAYDAAASDAAADTVAIAACDTG
jgi:hypothetical protein